MTAIAIVLLVLASFIALANLGGGIRQTQRARKGIPGGYSNVPFFSLIFCLVAWILAGDTIGIWVWLPTALDPGTWSLFILPFYLMWRWYCDRK
jgi:hypothetical protein